MRQPHQHQHAFASFQPRNREGLVLYNRRNMLKASMAGLAGLSLPGLLQQRASANNSNTPRRKSVILLWMAGGPSQIDTWDPKPDRPLINRGPFGTIPTRIPGVRICEHLPKQAAMLDKFTVIRSVDCRGSSHQPNQVMQTGNRQAAPRTNRKGHLYPGIGSLVAKHHGANAAGMPPYVTFMRHRTHVAHAGYLGGQYDPFVGNNAARLPIYDTVGTDTGRMTNAEMFQFAAGVDQSRIRERRDLLHQFDNLQANIDNSGVMESMGHFEQEAVNMLTGTRARDAFDLQQEPQIVRERYGPHLWSQQALLARRLVENGVAFVTLDLSYHPASGTWDTHGDNIPPYGGISRGLGPLLPLFDHIVTTLVRDLDQRGLLDDVLVIAMGEFGRTPTMGTQGSTDGRNHWPRVMSMCLAGGGLRHGQVIGASERDGGQIKERPVTPGDLAATIYRYFGVPLDTTYLDHSGRPIFAVIDGEPIGELF